MRKLLTLCCSLFLAAALVPLHAQDFQEELQQYRKEQHEKFSDPKRSPLDSMDLSSFTGLQYFEADSNYRVTARVELTPDSLPFSMPTSTERKARYRQFALLHFELQDSSYSLALYQNLRLADLPQYQDYYFLPFTDLSNGFSTYGGGRYLDIRYTGGDRLVIDFNKAYNPYCAYNSRYSCPIPPRQNHLELKIEAGVKRYK